jgi:hypothetical protein
MSVPLPKELLDLAYLIRANAEEFYKENITDEDELVKISPDIYKIVERIQAGKTYYHSTDTCWEIFLYVATETILFLGGVGGSKRTIDIINEIRGAAGVASYSHIRSKSFDDLVRAWNNAHIKSPRPLGNEFASIIHVLRDILDKDHPFCDMVSKLMRDTAGFVQSFNDTASTLRGKLRNFRLGPWYHGALYKVLYYEFGEEQVAGSHVNMKIFFDTFVVPLPGGRIVDDVWKRLFGIPYERYSEDVSFPMQRHFAKLAGCTPIDINSGLWQMGRR